MLMMRPSDQAIKKALVGIDGLLLAVLFGSAARSTLRPDSDIDVALLLDRPLAAQELDAISDRLALATGRAVDIVDLSQANGPLLRTVLNDGVVLIEKDMEARGRLAIRLLDWQEDFYPLWKKMHEARLAQFIAPTHA